MEVDDLYAHGRPYGGLAILYRASKMKFIQNLICLMINEYLLLYLMSQAQKLSYLIFTFQVKEELIIAVKFILYLTM